jgi:hypothetical protein
MTKKQVVTDFWENGLTRYIPFFNEWSVKRRICSWGYPYCEACYDIVEYVKTKTEQTLMTNNISRYKR